MPNRTPFARFRGTLAAAACLAAAAAPAAAPAGAAPKAAVHGEAPLVRLRAPSRGEARLVFTDRAGRPLAVTRLVDADDAGASTDGAFVTLGPAADAAPFAVALERGTVPIVVHATRRGGRGAPALAFVRVPPQWLAPPEARPATAGLDQAISDWVMANPDVIRAALDPSRQAFANAEAMRAEILSSGAPTLHEGDRAVTVVAFGDYRCGFTRDSFPSLQAALEEGAGVQVQEFAVLGPESEALARRALAAQRLGRYAAAHELLMAGDGAELGDAAFAAAIGADPAAFAEALASPAVAQAFDGARALAGRVGIGGTPAFLVYGPNGFRMSPGHTEPEGMLEMIESVR